MLTPFFKKVEFTHLTDPNSDGDGIGDAIDSNQNIQSNVCSGVDADLATVTVSNGNIVQCGAENSVTIISVLFDTGNGGGTLKITSPVMRISLGFSIPAGSVLSVRSMSYGLLHNQKH